MEGRKTQRLCLTCMKAPCLQDTVGFGIIRNPFGPVLFLFLFFQPQYPGALGSESLIERCIFLPRKPVCDIKMYCAALFLLSSESSLKTAGALFVNQMFME